MVCAPGFISISVVGVLPQYSPSILTSAPVGSDVKRTEVAPDVPVPALEVARSGGTGGGGGSAIVTAAKDEAGRRFSWTSLSVNPPFASAAGRTLARRWASSIAAITPSEMPDRFNPNRWSLSRRYDAGDDMIFEIIRSSESPPFRSCKTEDSLIPRSSLTRYITDWMT